MNDSQLPPQKIRIATILAFALIPLSGFATDIYLPSLPGMATSLGVSSVETQLTLSLFLVSYGIGQLFTGSVLDSFGRYRISLLAMLLFCISCVVVANTHDIYVIYAMRVVHGLTVATIVNAKRAFFVDMYSGTKLKHYLSLFTIIWSTGPIVAPFIGGYLQVHFGWESNFYFLALFGGVMLVLEFLFSGETLKQRSAFRWKSIVGVYYDMITTSSFIMGILMLGLAYSMVMIFNMTGPFIIEHHYLKSPVVSGYSSLTLGFAWMMGGLIGKATIDRPFVPKMRFNMVLQLLFVLAMIIGMRFTDDLYLMIAFAFIIHVTAGYTFNNYFTYCLSRFPNNAGIASGLTGGVTYMIVSSLSYLVVGSFPAKDAGNLSTSYLSLTILSCAVMAGILMLDRKSRRKAI